MKCRENETESTDYFWRARVFLSFTCSISTSQKIRLAKSVCKSDKKVYYKTDNSGVFFRACSNKNTCLPSASTSLIMSCSSASVGFCPSDLMTVPNSLVVMVPSPSLSNNEKASLNSAICSSVSWSAWKDPQFKTIYTFTQSVTLFLSKV